MIEERKTESEKGYMDQLLKKIYQNVVFYEKDTMIINQEIEEERSKLMEYYKEKMNLEEMEELTDRMSAIALTAEMAGFELGVRFAEKLLHLRSVT